MTLKAIARRYAAAAFDVARAKKDRGTDGTEQLGREISALAGVVTGHAELGRILETPAVPPSRKKAVVDALLDAGAAGKPAGLSDEIRRLVAVLGDHDRLMLLPDVAEAYAAELLAARRVVAAEVVTAVPLADKSRAALARALGQALGAEVTLSTRLDESIVGGVVAKVGSVVYDGSVTGHLNRLRQRLAADV